MIPQAPFPMSSVLPSISLTNRTGSLIFPHPSSPAPVPPFKTLLKCAFATKLSMVLLAGINSLIMFTLAYPYFLARETGQIFVSSNAFMKKRTL